ncbi:hypothetical protein LCGC14_2866930, partial [marine sediment metagenome]
YCNRPFKSVVEMDSILINNLKERINPKDILYFLGDLTFKEKVAHEFFEIFEDIEIYYIIGNHDSSKVINIAGKNCILDATFNKEKSRKDVVKKLALPSDQVFIVECVCPEDLVISRDSRDGPEWANGIAQPGTGIAF